MPPWLQRGTATVSELFKSNGDHWQDPQPRAGVGFWGRGNQSSSHQLGSA